MTIDIFLLYICRFVILVLAVVGEQIGWLEREVRVLDVSYVFDAYAIVFCSCYVIFVPQTHFIYV